MVSRRTNFGERSEPAPDRGGKLQSAGGAAQSNVSPLHLSGYNDTISSYEYRGCPVGSRDWLMGVSYYCVYDRVTSLLLSTIHPVKAGISLFHSSILRS